MDEADRALEHIAGVRAQLAVMLDHLDDILAEATDDERSELLEILRGIRRNRERGGHSLN